MVDPNRVMEEEVIKVVLDRDLIEAKEYLLNQRSAEICEKLPLFWARQTDQDIGCESES